MRPISKEAKIDIALVPQELNNGNVTGRYYHMEMWRRAMGVLMVGAMAAGKTVKLEFLQAKDASGTDAKGIPSTAAQAAKAEITANTMVTAATLTIAAAEATNAITVNGLTFTAIANGSQPDAAKRQWAVGTGTTANADSATALAAIINNATYGVPGVTASAADAVVTLTVSDPGETTITIEDAAATITPATTQALAFVELNVAQLDAGFEYIAVKVTTTANTIVAVSLIRDLGRFSPVQAVGASTVL